MLLSRCLPPLHWTCDSEHATKLFRLPAKFWWGRAPPGMLAVSGLCTEWQLGWASSKLLFAPLSASKESAFFFRRGGGIGVGLFSSRSKFQCLFWASLSDELAWFTVLDSWVLVRRLLWIEGGGGLGGGERDLSGPFPSCVLRHGLFRFPPTSWLWTFKKRGLIKHKAPLVWLHSSSEGVLVLIEWTPFMRQSCWEPLETQLGGGGCQRGDGVCSLSFAGELQKPESHYLVTGRMQTFCSWLLSRHCSTTLTHRRPAPRHWGGARGGESKLLHPPLQELMWGKPSWAGQASVHFLGEPGPGYSPFNSDLQDETLSKSALWE